jgi:glutathione synthase/RimK-type ligase-like ATP-grasp enzyme
VRPDDVDVALLGRLPSAFARTSPPGTVLDVDEHDRRQKQQAARHQLAWSMVRDLEARGVPVLSSPTRARPFDDKPLQLAALARAGVPIPHTIVDDVARVHDDLDVLEQVSKPIVGGVVEFTSTPGVLGQPRLRQHRLRGRQLRLAVVGGDIVAAGAIDVDGDWRTSALPFSPVALTPALAALATTVTTTCHFDVCAIDLVDDRDLGLCVLEANRTPALLDLARDVDVDIAAAVVALLQRSVDTARKQALAGRTADC